MIIVYSQRREGREKRETNCHNVTAERQPWNLRWAKRGAWGGFMLVCESVGGIIGLLLHNDRSLHAGTRAHVTSILSRFMLLKGHGPRILTPAVWRAWWNVVHYCTSHLRASHTWACIHIQTHALAWFHDMCCEHPAGVNSGYFWHYLFVDQLMFLIYSGLCVLLWQFWDKDEE